MRASHPVLLAAAVVGLLVLGARAGASAVADGAPALALARSPSELRTPLDDYVNLPDSAFKWDVVLVVDRPQYEVHILNVTSQIWHPPGEDAFELWHQVALVVPKGEGIVKTHSMLYLTGGANRPDRIVDPDDKEIIFLAAVAVSTRVVAAVMFHIPFQPMTFKTDPLRRSRSEDALIAYTWRMFLQNPSPANAVWLARLPMTKAAVRGFDAIQEFLLAKFPTQFSPTLKFVVGGGSKRGWTAWTVAAVDERVVGAAPIVLPMAKLPEQLHRHWRSYGGWSFAFKDYWTENVTTYVDTPQLDRLVEIVDPAVYFSRYHSRKIAMNVITGTNDEFFLPDEPSVWWDEFYNGELTHARMWPGCGHPLIMCITSVIGQMAAWLNTIVAPAQFRRPDLKWQIRGTGSPVIQLLSCSIQPKEMILWVAETPKTGRRDIRNHVGQPPVTRLVHWAQQPLAVDCAQTVRVKPADDPKVWRTFMVEYKFHDGQSYTTTVAVTPNEFPFPDCTREGCRGRLL